MAEIAFVLRLFVGFVFFASAVGKLLNPRPFIATVEQVLGLFVERRPKLAARAAMGMLIALECALALMFLAGIAPLTASLAAIGMFAVFAVVAAFAIRRGAEIDCRCFGASTSRLGTGTVVRAAALGLAAAVYGGASHAVGARMPTSSTEWISAFALVLGGAVLLALLGHMDTVLGLASERRRELQGPRTSEPAAEQRLTWEIDA